jgi:hypothetical protein
MFTTIRAALLSALALMLLPAAASAQPFPVSRDVGVYRTPDLSKGVGVIKAHETVNVECWTNGPAVGGYPIWDRIIGHPSGTAYVHDRYVEMPNRSGPAANKIPNCNDGGGGGGGGTPPAPTPCVAGTWHEYLVNLTGKHRDRWAPLYSVHWTARFCPRSGGDFNVEGAPVFQEQANPFEWIKAIELQRGEAEPSSDGRRVTYRARVKICPSTKFGGICVTAGRLQVIASLVGNRVRFDRVVETLPNGRRILFNTLLGFRHKPNGP